MKGAKHYFSKQRLDISIIVLLLVSLFLFPSTICAQQVTAIGSPASASATNSIASFTVAAGTNRVLVVTASDAASTNITGVTFNGITMTERLERNDGFAVDAIYTLVLGTSASSTAGAIIITSSNAVHSSKVITAMAFSNVNQANPLGGLIAADNTTPPSSSTLAVTSATGDLVFDIFDTFKSATPGSIHTAGGGQSIIHTITALPLSPSGFGWWTTSTKPGAGSVNMSRSTTDHGALIHLAASIKWDGMVLPVTLLSFNGISLNGNILLKWKITDAVNFKHFEIERSKDGTIFEKIGEVAQVDTNSTVQNYSFTDTNPNASLNYYRLKEVDIDGRFKYSGIIAIKNTYSQQHFSIYPNPAAGQIFITGIPNNNATYTIANTIGQAVLKGKLMANRPINVATLQKGVYYIFIDDKAVKFLKQ